MITDFTDFLNENFQFEHDVENEFDDVNELCFNNEIKKIPIVFVTNKNSKAFVDITALKNRTTHSITMTAHRLCISKNFSFTRQQLRDVLAHEMIHVLLAQRNIYKDYGGSHGMYFRSEMNRINKLNIGIKVGLSHDPNIKEIGIRDELIGKENKKTFFIYLQKRTNPSGGEHFNLTPFSNKDSLLEFWNKKIENLQYVLNVSREQKDCTFDVCMGETNLSDVGLHFQVSRIVKTAKLFIIDKSEYEKIKSGSTIYTTKILKND
jgi:hypothetical protein